MGQQTVRVEQVPSIPLAVIRRQASQGELSTLVPEFCGRVWTEVKKQGVKAGRHVAIYWNRDIRLEVGVELHGSFTDREPVVRSATPAGTVAVVRHLGPYNRLGEAHAAVRTWSEATGRTLAGPNWEIYGHWLDAWNTDPGSIITDVYYQIAAS
jgi:effector-binding domain-containing protein